jgi:hypothetical protein
MEPNNRSCDSYSTYTHTVISADNPIIHHFRVSPSASRRICSQGRFALRRGRLSETSSDQRRQYPILHHRRLLPFLPRIHCGPSTNDLMPARAIEYHGPCIALRRGPMIDDRDQAPLENTPSQSTKDATRRDSYCSRGRHSTRFLLFSRIPTSRVRTYSATAVSQGRVPVRDRGHDAVYCSRKMLSVSGTDERIREYSTERIRKAEWDI